MPRLLGPRQGAPQDNSLAGLSEAARLVWRLDRERFAAAMFAPPAGREALMVLYAFNIEVASVRERVREPMAGAIRLQWWRETVTGDRPQDEISAHPVARPLRALIGAGIVPTAPLLRLVDGREHDLSDEEFADLGALEAYAEATGATLAEAAAAALGATDETSLSAARHVGAAYALVGRLRLAAHQLSTMGLTPPPVLAGPEAVRLAAAAAGRRLVEARRLAASRRAVPALLPGTWAAAHLGRLERAGWDLSAHHLSRHHPMPLRLAFNALLGRF